jgi:hypothetical protein
MEMIHGIAIGIFHGKNNDRQIWICGENKEKFEIMYKAISKFATTIARDFDEKTTTSVTVNENFLPDIEKAADYLMKNKLTEPNLAEHSDVIDEFFRQVNLAKSTLQGYSSKLSPKFY